MPSGFTIAWIVSLGVAVLLGLPSFLVNAKKLREDGMLSSGDKWKRVLSSLAIAVVVVSSGIGLYGNLRLETELLDLKSIASWGGTGATVNTAVLSRYKNSYKAMLIFRLEVNSVDYLADREIAKSYFFDIDGEFHPVDVVLPDTFWNRVTSSTGYVHAYLVVVPQTVSTDDIARLADVKTHGGRIIAKRGSRAFLLMKRQSNVDKETVQKSH